jgi:hypothetical protein
MITQNPGEQAIAPPEAAGKKTRVARRVTAPDRKDRRQRASERPR